MAVPRLWVFGAVLFVVVTLPFVAKIGAPHPTKRRGVDDGLAKLRRAQAELEVLIHRLEDKTDRTDPATDNANKASQNCKDANKMCDIWAPCCPGGDASGVECSEVDCTSPGEAPCEGTWMAENCRNTCGTCPRMQLRYPPGSVKFAHTPPVATIWEKTNKSTGSLPGDLSWNIGHKRNPRILELHGVLNEEEAKEMREAARPHLKKSLVIHPTNSSEAISDVRTSSGMWMTGSKFSNLKSRNKLVDAMVQASGYPKTHFEALQILHYDPGQYYISHSDYFEPNMKEVIGASGNRIATAVTFLNTISPGKGGQLNFTASRPHVEFQPVTGNAVIFYNVKKSGVPDRASEHQAVPPEAGHEKWVAIFWIRLNPFSS